MAVLAVTAIAFAAVDDADARRLGGGRSFGTQRQAIVPPRATAPAPTPSPATPGAAANPVMPAQPGAVAPRAAAPTPAPAAPVRSGMSRWLGPIAGIAAGLGLAALLSHFGLSEAFGSFLLIALLAIGVIFLVRMFFARRSPDRMAYAARPQGVAAPASARDVAAWGRPDRVEPVLRPGEAEGARLPPGFDREGFVREARNQFRRIQGAWDAGDRRALAEVMTPELFEEVSRDLGARGTHLPTDIVNLDADVLDVATEGDKHWASVRFTGLLREDGGSTPKTVDETWNLVKPTDDSSGWLLAGIQQNEPAAIH